jgi:hypothetical protein
LYRAALKNNIFTELTDVWSFGILLFEIFSYGKEPYQDLEMREWTSPRALLEHIFSVDK